MQTLFYLKFPKTIIQVIPRRNIWESRHLVADSINVRGSYWDKKKNRYQIIIQIAYLLYNKK